MSLTARIDIGASPEHVWAVLADLGSWRIWNPFMPEAAGTVQQGATMEVLIAPPGGRAMRFKPTLLVVQPGRRLTWRGSVLFRGLFDGTHDFVLERLDGRHVRFTQSETFSGILAPVLVTPSFLETAQRGFVAMNEALKRRAEEPRLQAAA
ncbi:MAG: SRPBCC domain-containing protein [Hyphomicrobiales bacterium]